MKTIYKFKLEVTDVQHIQVPFNAEALCVQVQNGEPCLWVKLDPTKEKFKRTIVTCGTGHRIGDNDGRYLGTYQLEDGKLVFHVFERKGL